MSRAPRKDARVYDGGGGMEAPVDRTMRVLAEAQLECDDDVVVPSVPVEALKQVLDSKAEAEKKVATIAELVKAAVDNIEVDKLRRKNERLHRQIRELEQDRRRPTAMSKRMEEGDGGGGGHASGRASMGVRHAKGFYIPAAEVSTHPMSVSSRYLRMMLGGLLLFFIVQPIFISLTIDKVVTNILFFVLTLLLSLFVGRQYWETSEQELRAMLPEPEFPESHEPRLSYSMFSYACACVTQLLFALYSARAEITVVQTVIITVVSSVFLVLAFYFVLAFERVREVSE